ncbi:MAG TPA: hypothetical protein VNI36_01105 [Candidatus Dormibacteraeota bacterium]|nr:hypothetical protein [Candidatus Dormibacteraeota bacterium]
MSMSTSIGIPNLGAMSAFVGAFDVTSRLTEHAYHCQFSHMWNGIATRHSDTVDTKFLVDGKRSIVGLAHTAFISFKDKHGRDLSDREASYIAAEYLREQLEQEDERPLYDVSAADVTRIIGLLGLE